MSAEEKPKPPLSGVIYGQLIYWIVLAGSVIVVLGSVIAFITHDNFASASYWITSIWQGESTTEIWQGTKMGSLPLNHWYLSRLATGDGLSAFGLSLGVFSVIPALLGSAIILYKKKLILYSSLAVIAAMIVAVAMLGLVPIPT